MDEPESVDSPAVHRAVVWALSSFHTALLVALVVGGLYAGGVAGELLAGLDTWVGVLAYCYLWAVVWWTNSAMLSGIEGDLVTERPEVSALLVQATKWGATAGLLVFFPVLLLGTVAFVGAGGLGAVLYVLVGGAIGALLSAGVGVAIGVLFASLDLLLLRAAGGWLGATRRGPTPSNP